MRLEILIFILFFLNSCQLIDKKENDSLEEIEKASELECIIIEVNSPFISPSLVSLYRDAGIIVVVPLHSNHVPLDSIYVQRKLSVKHEALLFEKSFVESQVDSLLKEFDKIDYTSQFETCNDGFFIDLSIVSSDSLININLINEKTENQALLISNIFKYLIMISNNDENQAYFQKIDDIMGSASKKLVK